MRRLLLIALVALPATAYAGRNGSGTYSLPASGAGWTNPVTSGSTISSAWANTTLADITQGLTDSLDRNGRGAMLQPLKIVDGTAGYPGITFSNDQTSGLYRIGAGNIGLSVSATPVLTLVSAGVSIPGTLGVTGTLTAGTLSVPGTSTLTGSVTMSGAASIGGLLTLLGGNLAFNQAADQGVHKIGGGLDVGTDDAHDLNFVVNGVRKWYVANSSGDLTAFSPQKISNVATPTALTDAATKGYVDAGPTFTGKPVAPSTVAGDAATVLVTKGYVDARVPAAHVVLTANQTVTSTTANIAGLASPSIPSGYNVVLHCRVGVSFGGGTAGLCGLGMTGPTATAIDILNAYTSGTIETSAYYTSGTSNGANWNTNAGTYYVDMSGIIRHTTATGTVSPRVGASSSPMTVRTGSWCDYEFQPDTP